MAKVSSSRDRDSDGRVAAKRSKKSVTIASWRTDRSLRIVRATRDPASPLQSLPKIGQVIDRRGDRRVILRAEPHLRALKGRPSRYEIQLSHRTYQVDVAPRLGRNGKVLGVEGKLSGPNEPIEPFPPKELGDLGSLKRIVSQRQRNSMKSAIRSLELAKAVADTARMGAEVRRLRALEQQEKAERERTRAEEDERRARFLADASAVLDSSLDFRVTTDQVSRLIVMRIADWCAVQIEEEGVLRRAALFHRDPRGIPLLEQVIPEAEAEEEEVEEEESLFPRYRSVQMAQPMVFPSVTPADLYRIAHAPSRLAALKKVGVHSLVQTPIRAHGRTLGLLTLGSNDGYRLYDILDLQMAQSLAYRIGLAHESSVLYAEAQREISRRKEAEARMMAFNAELERRVRERTSLLEEATREANSFAYTVAHDLRAPLRAITGFCQALKEDYSATMDAVGQDYLERIVSGSRRMDDLIRDLLDYARVNRAEIKRSKVDLDEIVDTVMESMSAELRERKAVVERVGPLGTVMAHEPMLNQVITNLLSNAVKFVAREVSPTVAISSESREGRARLLFKDNGIGIAPEHHDRIFGIFERLNRAEEYPGTGIGLAIVRRAVERLGGSVGVESKPQEGSTFWVELPVT